MVPQTERLSLSIDRLGMEIILFIYLYFCRFTERSDQSAWFCMQVCNPNEKFYSFGKKLQQSSFYHRHRICNIEE